MHHQLRKISHTITNPSKNSGQCRGSVVICVVGNIQICFAIFNSTCENLEVQENEQEADSSNDVNRKQNPRKFSGSSLYEKARKQKSSAWDNQWEGFIWVNAVKFISVWSTHRVEKQTHDEKKRSQKALTRASWLVGKNSYEGETCLSQHDQALPVTILMIITPVQKPHSIIQCASWSELPFSFVNTKRDCREYWKAEWKDSHENYSKHDEFYVFCFFTLQICVLGPE